MKNVSTSSSTMDQTWVLLDGLIGTLQLPEKGGVALVGWSMGNIFTLSMLASVHTLPAPVRRRLSLYVKRAIMWGMFH